MTPGLVKEASDLRNTSVVKWGDDQDHMIILRTGEHELIVLDGGSTTSYVTMRLFPLHAAVFTPCKGFAYASRRRVSPSCDR